MSTGDTIESLLQKDVFDDITLAKFIPEWSKLIGTEGYQHNKVLLGAHIKDAIHTVKQLPEYQSLSDSEKNLALIATLFHDFGKPVGRKTDNVRRDFSHEIPSSKLADEYMKRWGYPALDRKIVTDVILNDGIVSDIARRKVRDEKKRYTPEQFRSVLENNESTIKILRAVNRADIIATVGAERYEQIANVYNKYFDEVLRI